MKNKKLVLKYCLQNAVFYGGKANPDAVLGKIMANEPKLRKYAAGIKKEIIAVVKQINSLSPDDQKKKLRNIDPKMMKKEIKKQEDLSDIPRAEKGKIITRFAPSPTGPLSLPHLLRAAMLSYLYAKKYNGKFILRFEDTDPKNIKIEFYDWIKEDLKNSGIKPDQTIKESDNMELYYRYAEDLMKKGKLYVCSCSAEKFKKLKIKKKDCGCRNFEGTEKWKAMLSGEYDEGQASVRLKISMKNPNPALRDPVMFRVVKASHPLKKKKYKVWPLYNFASVIEDHQEDITHVFRGKEHEHNTGIQNVLYEALGWEAPIIINFGMIYLPGEKIHTRDIKKWITKGKVSGWDDPKLHTVRALLRRGFQPETFKRCAIGCGLSKTDIRFTWETLEGTNRKVIDPIANRYMVVKDPVKISLKNAPKTSFVSEAFHPDFPKRGKKKMPIDSNNVFISREDFRTLKSKTFRLKGLGNFRIKDKTAKYAGNKIERSMQKIQWVSKPNIKVKIVTPQGNHQAIGEHSMKTLKPGDMIQMERMGFGRIDSVNQTIITVYFAHK